eukprot:gene19425-25303_t
MPSHVIDYFATLGRRDGQLAIRSSNEQINLTPKDTWFEAITDIAVLIEGEEKLNSEWEVCDKSSGGLDLFPPHIAIKRRKYSKRLDHIVEIRLVQEGAVIPKEFELIRLSSSGKYNAYLNPIGFLAIRRGVNTNMQYIHGDWSIHKLEIVLYCEGEELQEDYHEVKTVLPVSNSNNHQNNHIANNVVAIALQKVKPIGFCDFTYEYATIDRYPIIDQKDAQLPANELPMFGFPQGLRLHYGSNQQYPLPVFFTFVFTDYKGDHFYAECLRFYENIDNNDVLKLFNDVYDVNINSIDDIDLFHDNGLFCPKVICLISRRPFYRAMRRLLKQIYSLSLSSIPCPIEFFISSLINLIPLPVEGGRPFHIILDAALISSTSRSLAPIIFQQPHKAFFPLMDLDFSAPFKCLSVDNIVAVFALMLREAKIVFISQSNILLTETMETFRSLLFPLVWSSCFVSPLPDALSGMLEAPGGFMVGFHIAHDPADEKSNIEKQLNKGISLIDQQSWSYSLTPGKSPVVHRESEKKRMSIGFPDIIANKMLSAMDSTVSTAVSSAVQTPMISPVQNKTQEVSPSVPLSSRISKLLSPFMSSTPTTIGQASNNITPIPEVNNNTPVPSSNEPKKNKRRSTRRRNTVRTLAMRESFSDEEGSEYDEDETNDDIESLDTEGKDIETDNNTNKSNEDSNIESIIPLSILSDLSLEDHIQTENKKSSEFMPAVSLRDARLGDSFYMVRILIN